MTFIINFNILMNEHVKYILLYTANEWQHWILYFSVVVMQPFLPRQKFQTLQKLSRAVTLLLDTRISHDQMNEAGQLLEQFAIEFAEQYGKSNVVMNVHLLGNHLIEACRNYGPLWTFWCYPFENMLGTVKKFIHGTKKPEKSYIFGANLTNILPGLEARELRNISNWDSSPHKIEVL